MLPRTASHKTALIINIDKDISFEKLPSLDIIFGDIRANSHNVLAFDMSEVDYVNFETLAFFLEASFRCKVADIEMIVFGVSHDIMAIMKVSTIDKMLTVFPKDEVETNDKS